MTDLPPRRRGRPTKAESEAREKAVKAAQVKREEEDSFLNNKLSQPIKRRGAKLHPDEDTLRTISELGKLFCTQQECAAVLGVSLKTLTKFFSEFSEAREVWDDGLQYAKISLRRKQMGLADKNAPAAIFLGKNYLSQKDESTVNTNVTHDVKKMTEEQLEEIASRATSESPKEQTRH